VLSVVGDVPVDSEPYVVTSSISSRKFAGPVFEGAHMGRVRMRAFIGMSVRAL
jgi:hypothetical protein